MTTYTGTGTLQSPKTQFVVTIVLVFLVGTVVGALVMNLGAHKGLHRAAFWSDTGREISLHRLQKELDLTPDQTLLSVHALAPGMTRAGAVTAP